MIGLLHYVLAMLVSPFKSKSRLEAENAVLRHQLIVLRRKVKGRAQITYNDRWFFVQLYRRFPSILELLTIIRPIGTERQTVVFTDGAWRDRIVGTANDGAIRLVAIEQELTLTGALAAATSAATLAVRRRSSRSRTKPSHQNEIASLLHPMGRNTFFGS
jgi:hypothetical protein